MALINYATTISDYKAAVSDADTWICGSAKLGDSIKSFFVNKGVSHHGIHQELFDLR